MNFRLHLLVLLFTLFFFGCVNSHHDERFESKPVSYSVLSRSSYFNKNNISFSIDSLDNSLLFTLTIKKLKNFPFPITNQRTRITGILKKHKTDKTLNLLGCSAQFLRTYIENKFLEGMTWDNYGKHGWHIDHIIPCSSFNLTDSTQQQICFHYTNLQPLWAIDNLKKSNKILSKG